MRFVRSYSHTQLCLAIVGVCLAVWFEGFNQREYTFDPNVSAIVFAVVSIALLCPLDRYVRHRFGKSPFLRAVFLGTLFACLYLFGVILVALILRDSTIGAEVVNTATQIKDVYANMGLAFLVSILLAEYWSNRKG